MKMNAREMFEELGFEFEELYNQLYYVKVNESNYIEEEIKFDLDDDELCISVVEYQKKN